MDTDPQRNCSGARIKAGGMGVGQFRWRGYLLVLGRTEQAWGNTFALGGKRWRDGVESFLGKSHSRVGSEKQRALGEMWETQFAK